MAKGKDPSTQKQGDFDDELSDILSQTENDFGDEMFDLEGIDSEEDRAPASKTDTMTDTLNHAGKKAAKGAVTGIVTRIESDLPDASRFVNDGLAAIGQLNATKDEFLNQVTPVVNETKKIASRLLKQVDDIVPKGIYERLNRFLTNTEQSETAGTPSKADIRKNEMNSAIEALFAGQSEQMAIDRKVDMANRIQDQKLENARHKESASILSSILNQSQFHTSFLRSTYTAYIKKDLEIKFRSLYLQEDLVDVTRIMSQMLEKKLETIRHNTSLPDAQKIHLTEIAAQKAKEEMIGGFSRWTSGYLDKLTKNIREEWLDPALEGLGSFNDMGEMLVSMMEDEQEMTGQKFSAKKSMIGGLAGWLGGKVGSSFAGKAIKKALRPQMREFLSGVGKQGMTGLQLYLERYRKGEIDFLDKDGNETFLGSILNLLSNVVPEMDYSAGTFDNDAAKNPNAPGAITKRFTTTIEQIIPAYLMKQTKYLKAIAYDVVHHHGAKGVDRIQEDIFDYGKGRLVSKDTFLKEFREKAFGSKEQRASILKGHAETVMGLVTSQMDAIDADDKSEAANKKREKLNNLKERVQKAAIPISKIIHNLAMERENSLDMVTLSAVAGGDQTSMTTGWGKKAFQKMSFKDAQLASSVFTEILANDENGVRRRNYEELIRARIVETMSVTDRHREEFAKLHDRGQLGLISALDKTLAKANDKDQIEVGRDTWIDMSTDVSEKDIQDVTGRYDALGNDLTYQTAFDRAKDYFTSYEFKHQAMELLGDVGIKLDGMFSWLFSKLKMSKEYEQWKANRSKNIEDLKKWFDKTRARIRGWQGKLEGYLWKFARWAIKTVGRSHGEELVDIIFEKWDDQNELYKVKDHISSHALAGYIARYPWLVKTLGEIYAKSHDRVLYWFVLNLLPEMLYLVAVGDEKAIKMVKEAEKQQEEEAKAKAEKAANAVKDDDTASAEKDAKAVKTDDKSQATDNKTDESKSKAADSDSKGNKTEEVEETVVTETTEKGADEHKPGDVPAAAKQDKKKTVKQKRNRKTRKYAEGGTYDPKTGQPINGVHTKAHTFANGNAEIGEHGAETAVPLNGSVKAKKAWYTTLQHFLFGIPPRDAAKMSKKRERSLDTIVASLREYIRGRTPEAIAAEYIRARQFFKDLGKNISTDSDGMIGDGVFGIGGGKGGNGGGGSAGAGKDKDKGGGFWSSLFGVKDTDAGKENEEALLKMRGKIKAAKRGASLGYTTLGTLHKQLEIQKGILYVISGGDPKHLNVVAPEFIEGLKGSALKLFEFTKNTTVGLVGGAWRLGKAAVTGTAKGMGAAAGWTANKALDLGVWAGDKLSGVAKGIAKRYTDIYLSGGTEPILTAAAQQAGEVCYEDGSKPMSSYTIKNALYWADTEQNRKLNRVKSVVITTEQVPLLLDKDGKPLNRFATKLGAITNLAAAKSMGALKWTGGKVLDLGKLTANGVMGLVGNVAGFIGGPVLNALKAVTVRAFKGKNPYVDVYSYHQAQKKEDGKELLGNPLLTGTGIRDGEYVFNDGTRVTSAYKIKIPVLSAKDNNTLVTDEDITSGLFTIDADGNRVDLTAFAGKSLAGKALSILGSATFGLGKKIVGTSWKALKAVGKGIKAGAGGLAELLGMGTDFFSKPMEFVKSVFKARQYINRDDLEQVVGYRLDMIYAHLTGKPMPKLVLESGTKDAEAEAVKEGEKKQKKQFQWFGIRDKLLLRKLKKLGVKLDEDDTKLLSDPEFPYEEKLAYADSKIKEAGIDPDEKKKKSPFFDNAFGKKLADFKKDLFGAKDDIVNDFKKRQEQDKVKDLKQKMVSQAKLASGSAKVIANLTKRSISSFPLIPVQMLAGGNTKVLKKGICSIAFSGVGDEAFSIEVAKYMLATLSKSDGTIDEDKLRRLNVILMQAKIAKGLAKEKFDKLSKMFRKGSYEDQQEREKEDEAKREKKKKEKEETDQKKKRGIFSRMAGIFHKGGAAGAAGAAASGGASAMQTGMDAISTAADVKDLTSKGKAAGTAAKAAKVGRMARLGSTLATAGRALGIGASLIGPIGTLIAANPIGWAIGAVALAGAVGYGAWKLFSDSDEVELWRDTRLEAYGLPTGSAYEDEIEDLEEEALEIIDGERIPFTNEELMKWARKFGIITDKAGPDETLDTGKGTISLDPVMMTKFFTTWYNKRFIPIYSAYVKMMREATDAGVGDDPDPDDLNDEQQKPLMDAFKKVCNTISSEKETSLLVPTFDGYVKAMESGFDAGGSENESRESDEEFFSKRDEELKAEAEAKGKTIVKDDEFSQKSAKDMLSDMFRDMGDNLSSTWHAITNPIDTIQNLFESVGEGAFRDAYYTAVGIKKTDKRIRSAIDWLTETYLEYFEARSGSRIISEEDLDEFIARLDLRTNSTNVFNQENGTSYDSGAELTAAARKGKMRTYIREYINKRFLPIWKARYVVIRRYSETKVGDDLDLNDIPERMFAAAIKGITESVKTVKKSCPEFDDLTPDKAGFTKWLDRVAEATGVDKFDSEVQAVSDVDQDKVKEFESGINANKKEGFWGKLGNSLAQMANDAISWMSSDGTNVAQDVLIWVLDVGASKLGPSKLEEIKAKAYGFRLDDVAMMRSMETRENEIYTKQKDPYTEEDLHALGTAMKIIPVPTESTKLTEEAYKASKKYFVTWYAKRFQAVFSYIVQIAHTILKANDSDSPGLPDLNILSNDQKKQFEAMLDKAIGKLVGEYPAILKYSATKRGLERWLANDALELGLMPDAARLKAIEDQRKMEEQAANKKKYYYGTRTFGGPAQPDPNANNSGNPSTSAGNNNNNQSPTSTGSMVNATGSPSFTSDGSSIIGSLNTAAISAASIPDGGNGDLGAYVKEFESGSRGSSAIGHDRTGGTSYGTYQIAAKTGTLDRFLKFAQAEGEFGSQLASAMAKAGALNTGSTKGAAPDVWRKFAELNPAAMRALEHKFIKKTHYDVALQLIKDPDARKLIESDRGLQESLWSTSVQHGGGGAASIFSKTYKPGITAADWLKAIYASRSTKFGSSTADVRRSVLNRYKRELPIMLGLSGVAPSNEGSADASQDTQSASGASAPTDGTAQAPEASADAKTADSATAGSTSDSSSSASATAAASAASTPTSSTTTTSATGTVSSAAASVAAVVQSNMAQMNTPTTLSGASSSTPITAINNPNTIAASNQKNESIPVLKNIESILSEIRDVLKNNTSQDGSATISGGIDYGKMTEAVATGVKQGTPINELANMLFKLATPATLEITNALSNMAIALKSTNAAPSIDTSKQAY